MNSQHKKKRYAPRICKRCKNEFPPTIPWMFLCRKCGKITRYEKRQEKFAKYRELHREELREKHKQRSRERRTECLIAYGGSPPKCSCCGELHVEFLSIHHVNGDGKTDRMKPGRLGSCLFFNLRKLGFPPGYAVLCHNCNLSLGFYGYCPHNKEKPNAS
jgi:hypothetical protein